MHHPRAALRLACLLASAALHGCGINDRLAASSGVCGGPPATPGPEGCALVCRGVVPVRAVDSTPAMTVWLNDKPEELLLDTGAGLTAITAATAARLGLPVRSASGAIYGIGGSQERHAVDVNSLAFGMVRLGPRPIDVLEFGKFAVPPAGALGADVLRGYEVELDFPHGVMRLYEGRACPGLPPGWTSAGFVVPFGSQFEGRQPVVPVELDGVRLQAVLDSGAARSGVSVGFARRAQVSEAELASELATRSVGVGPATADGRLHQFTHLRIGPETTPDFEADVLDLRMRGIDMLLGDDYLRQHKVWVSYGRNEVRIASDW